MDNRLISVLGLLIFTLTTIFGCNSGGGVSSAPAPKPSSTYIISGTVTNLAGSGLILQGNGGGNLAVSSNGNFIFSTALSATGGRHD